MIALCCSQKGRKRLGLADKMPPPRPSTSALGDWYVSLFHFGKHQVVMATSERSLLTVVFLARELRKTLEENLRTALHQVLHALGVEPGQAFEVDGWIDSVPVGSRYARTLAHRVALRQGAAVGATIAAGEGCQQSDQQVRR